MDQDDHGSLEPAFLDEALGQAGADERLGAQLRFVLELDKAKTVLRRTYLTDGSRREDDAEHMWHAVVAALVLAEHADEPVDVARLVAMVAIHDVVEIDAGDTFLYDDAAGADKAEREGRAAERIFGILPDDQRDALVALWEEFEAAETPTARMAAAIDRLLPLLMNRAVGGRTWREHEVPTERVYERNSVIGDGSTPLWALGRAVLDGAVRSGLLPEPASTSAPAAGPGAAVSSPAPGAAG